MSKAMPPLNPLLVFVAAARAGSFSEAAEKLGVTQSAVSRQIAVLEGFLGMALFRRGREGAQLTPEGDAYHQAVAPAFDAINLATERLRRLRAADTHLLRLRVHNTFAALWLIPRLHRFESRHPLLKVRITNAVEPVNFDRDDVDLAIQFGDGHRPGSRAKPLLPDAIQPVCAPSLLRRHRLAGPHDLRGLRLLQARHRREDWQDWLRAFGLSDVVVDAMEFPTSVLAYQAAKEGLGVAMGQVRLLGEGGADGLVPLFEPLERPMAHYLVLPERGEPGLAARAFIAWLDDEIAAGREPAPPPVQPRRLAQPRRSAGAA